MSGSASTHPVSLPLLALLGVGGALVGLSVWFSAVAGVGEPTRATGLLVMSMILVLAVRTRVPLAKLGIMRTRALTGMVLLLVAASGALVPATTSLIGATVPGGLMADALLVLAWGIVLFPLVLVASLVLEYGRHDRSGAVAALAGATASVAVGPALMAGLPPVLLTAVGAVAASPALVRVAPSGKPTAPFPAHEAFSVGLLLCLLPLTLPPLLASFAGAVPASAVALSTAGALGWALGRAILPGKTPRWLGPVLLGGACLATLMALEQAVDVALLSRGDGDGPGAASPLLPWLVLAAAVGIPAGLGLAAWRGGAAAGRPGWLSLGVLAGLLVALGLVGRGAADVPARAAAGLAAAAAMGMLIQPSEGESRAGGIVGWIATTALIGGLILLPPLATAPAALDTFARVPRTDMGLLGELEEVMDVQSSMDRSGLRCSAVTAAGVHLARGGQAHPPDRAAELAETFAALLPTLATPDAQRALVVHPGRGGALVALSGAGMRDVAVLDRSPFAAAQIAGLDDVRRDAITNPAVHFERKRALPTLSRQEGPPEIVIVQLPPAWQLGSEAWYGPRLARQAARAVDPGGWVAFVVPTRHLSEADLAGTLVAFNRFFPGATIWLDPAGHGDLILLGSAAGERPSGDRILLGLDRRGLRPVARSAGILTGDDLLRRLFASTAEDAFAEAARSPSGLSWRGAKARLAGEEAIPLLTFAQVAAPPEHLLDLSRVDEETLARITGAGRHVDPYWTVYLTFLDRIARQEDVESLEWARELRGASDDPTADLAPLVRETIDAGRVAAERGMRSDAEALLLLAEAFSPDDPEVHEELGRLAWAEQREDDALRRFEAALELDPERLVSLLGAADLRLRRGERKAARGYLERATKAHPQSVDALYNLARLDLDEGQREAARTGLQQAHDLDPSRERVLFSLAEVSFLDAVELREGGEPYQERLEQARRGALRALEVERAPSTLCLYGQIQLIRGDAVEAEQVLTEALEAAPRDFDTRAALGEVYMARHQYSASAQQFLEAEQLRPDDIRVQQRLTHLRKLAPYAFEDRPGAGGVYSPAPPDPSTP